MPDWKNIKIVRYWKEKVGHWGEKKSKEKGGRGHRLLSKQKSGNKWNSQFRCPAIFEIVQKSFSHIKKMMKDVDVGFWLLKNIPSWCVTKIIALMISVRIFTPTPFREMNTYRKDPPEFGNAPSPLFARITRINPMQEFQWYLASLLEHWWQFSNENKII